MSYTLAFDLGQMTGVVLGEYDYDAWRLVDAWQFAGGAQALSDFVSRKPWVVNGSMVICEKFVLRRNNFVADLEGVRGEGVLIHHFGEDSIVWQLRTAKANVPDQILKDHGLWMTGKRFGTKDARDANDCVLHSLAYMKSIKHEPTIKEYFG